MRVWAETFIREESMFFGILLLSLASTEPVETSFSWTEPTNAVVNCESTSTVLAELYAILYQDAFTSTLPQLVSLRRNPERTFSLEEADMLLRLQFAQLKTVSLIAQVEHFETSCQHAATNQQEEFQFEAEPGEPSGTT